MSDFDSSLDARHNSIWGAIRILETRITALKTRITALETKDKRLGPSYVSPYGASKDKK